MQYELNDAAKISRFMPWPAGCQRLGEMLGRMAASCGEPYADAFGILFEKTGPYFEKCHGTLAQTPGSKHHRFVGGLAMHAMGVARLAQWAEGCDPRLLRFVALVHDVGKLMERADGPGHAEISADLVTEALRDAKASGDVIERCRHCMLSHHGALPGVAPEEPSSPEAAALAGADLLDGMIMSTSMDPRGTPCLWQEGAREEWRELQDEWLSIVSEPDESAAMSRMVGFLQDMPENFLGIEDVQRALLMINPKLESLLPQQGSAMAAA